MKRSLSSSIDDYQAQLLVSWSKGAIKQEDYDDLERTLRTISAFIVSSYRMSSNPLPHLRKCFPTFAWRMQKTKDIGEVMSVVLKHDYTFAVDDCEDGLVTGLEKADIQRPRAVYFTDDDHLSFPEALEQFAITVGAKPDSE